MISGGFLYPEYNGCCWPVIRGYAKDGGVAITNCARSGYGDRLPVCHQHADALIDAAAEIIASHGCKLGSYRLMQLLENINKVRPWGLDEVLIERINAIRCEDLPFTGVATAERFREAVDQLLMDRLQERWSA